MSLKKILNDKIKESGYLSIDQMEVLCKEYHYKISNAERRLRQSESPLVERVMKDGYIIGYRPKQLQRTLF